MLETVNDTLFHTFFFNGLKDSKRVEKTLQKPPILESLASSQQDRDNDDCIY